MPPRQGKPKQLHLLEQRGRPDENCLDLGQRVPASTLTRQAPALLRLLGHGYVATSAAEAIRLLNEELDTAEATSACNIRRG